MVSCVLLPLSATNKKSPDYPSCLTRRVYRDIGFPKTTSKSQLNQSEPLLDFSDKFPQNLNCHWTCS